MGGEAPEYPALPLVLAAGVGPQAGEPVVQEGYADLSDGDAGRPLARTEVDAAAEAEMGMFGAGDVEGVGALEGGRIPVGGADDDAQYRVGGQFHAVQD